MGSYPRGRDAVYSKTPVDWVLNIIIIVYSINTSVKWFVSETIVGESDPNWLLHEFWLIDFKDISTYLGLFYAEG